MGMEHAISNPQRRATTGGAVRYSGRLLIGKHFTLQLDLFNDSQLDILEGQVCRALCFAVSSVRNRPRTALHRPASNLGYGLPSLKAHASQLRVCRLHKITHTPGYIWPEHAST
jgi:hypothetical protein